MLNKKVQRCPWIKEGDDLYEKYHDEEWGVPVYDDKKIFEFLILESAQAGLSWRTILGKRESYKKAFAHFDFNKIAKFDIKKINSLLKNKGIIRNRLKIESAINNAKKFLEVRKEFGTFSSYIWSFVDGKPIKNKIKNIKDYRATSKESDLLARDMKKRGFKFLGSTTLYAHMQATGVVNDHSVSCFKNKVL